MGRRSSRLDEYRDFPYRDGRIPDHRRRHHPRRSGHVRLGALIGLGHLEFWSAYWWSTWGAIVGDAISFWIGRVFHQSIRRVWPFAKHPEMLARSEEFFRKHGGKGVLFGRFFGPCAAPFPPWPA